MYENEKKNAEIKKFILSSILLFYYNLAWPFDAYSIESWLLRLHQSEILRCTYLTWPSQVMIQIWTTWVNQLHFDTCNSISGYSYLAWLSQSVPIPCLCWPVGRPLVGLLRCTGSGGWYTGCLWCWTDSIPSTSKVIYLNVNWHNFKVTHFKCPNHNIKY